MIYFNNFLQLHVWSAKNKRLLATSLLRAQNILKEKNTSQNLFLKNEKKTGANYFGAIHFMFTSL